MCNPTIVDEPHLASVPARNTLIDRIAALRQVFCAIDFDVLLWDSLFQLDDEVSKNSSIQSLRAVLEFLEIDAYSTIPDEYLDMEPASSALEEFQIHHGHLHDSLLHSLCMALAHFSSSLYVQYARETAQSVQDLERMYDAGITVLTRINHHQLLDFREPMNDEEIEEQLNGKQVYTE